MRARGTAAVTVLAVGTSDTMPSLFLRPYDISNSAANHKSYDDDCNYVSHESSDPV